MLGVFMGAIIALLAPLLIKMFGGPDSLAGQYLKTKADQQQAKADYDLKVLQNKKELAAIEAQAAVESEKNKLAATSQGFKSITFLLINIPIIIVCIMPSRGKELFENLMLVPVWYAQLYAAIYGIIWGMPVAANAMGVIMNSISNAWSIRNHGKIEKIQALGEANMVTFEQAKKAVFEIQRSLSPTGMLSKQQVDTLNPIIEKSLDLAKAAVESQGNDSSTTVNTGDNK